MCSPLVIYKHFPCKLLLEFNTGTRPCKFLVALVGTRFFLIWKNNHINKIYIFFMFFFFVFLLRKYRLV